jgi:type VI secretion system protein ImpL
MQLSWHHFVAGLGLVVAAMLSWFGAQWLHLQGANLWFFRLCVFLLLALAVVAALWWLQRREKTKSADAAAAGPQSIPGAGVADDIELILREAEDRVASSAELPRGTRLASLPVMFLVGDSGAGKTCVAIQSGLEPELLSGQIYQEGSVAPTLLANLWFAHKTVFVEMGGKTLADPALWSRLLYRLAPGRLRLIFSGKPTAPRAAVVCFDAEKLAKAADPEEITAQSRTLRSRLEQISQTLKISFPVYVLFTRSDRLPYFGDFFRNLSDAEITQVLGVTLPPLPASATGVYAEQETKRLTAAFNSIFYSLAECRPGLLYRERNAEKLAGIYEFPRELQKRIPIATQFLVDLCRPSHLRSGPFLRGFYFTGIRQVEAAPPGGTAIDSKTSFMPARSFSANATSLLRVDDFTKTRDQDWQSATQPGAAGGSRKITQWLFLSHIFSQVTLQDHAALEASTSSSRANVWKRVLLATAGALATVCLLGILISFFGNHALQQDVRRAANGIVPIGNQGLSMASLEDLQRLDVARVQLAKLTRYQRAGAPWRLHWGLYTGPSLYQDFRPLYFDRFKKLLFGDVQNQMASFLRSRPASPTNPSDADYITTYDTLKAYLMTTLNPEKSNTPFLSGFLQSKWSGPLDSPEQNRLAIEQFKFYADELHIDNPFPRKDDLLVAQAVDQGRHYLIALTGANLVYRGYLAKLRQTGLYPPLNFSAKYPEAAGIVREPQIIDGAFTKEGWKFMQSLISRNEWNTDDEWVLGPAAKEILAHGVSTGDVQKIYQADYIDKWRSYVKSASVAGLGGPVDASRKLEKLTGNRSPLFELLCEVSENTAGTSNAIIGAFQPVSDVVKAPCYNLVVQDTTTAYRNALSELMVCIQRFQENPSDPATQREDAYKSCKTQLFPVVTKEASNAVKTVDHEADLDRCVVSLLKLGGCAPGKALPEPARVSDTFCSTLNRLASKYPFKTDSSEELTMEEFESFFRPGTGVLSREIATGGATGTSRSNLLKMAVNIQKSLYPNGSPTLQYHFVVTAPLPKGMKSGQLNLDGAVVKLSEAGPNTQSFVWPGKNHEAELRFSDSTSLGPFAGPWAVFRLLGVYNWSTGKGGLSHLESPFLKSPQGLAFKDTLDLKAEGVPLFRRGYLSSLRCSTPQEKR